MIRIFERTMVHVKRLKVADSLQKLHSNFSTFINARVNLKFSPFRNFFESFCATPKFKIRILIVSVKINWRSLEI